MDFHPFLNHAKFMVCVNQIMQWDIFSLYLNTFFSMAFVAFIPCICVVWGFIAAPNKMSLLSVLKSISLKTRLCVYPIIYPLITYKGLLPFLVAGWLPLLVSSLKMCEVLITSPATFPWLSYAARNRPGYTLFEWNFVELAHSAAMNQNWVQYELCKNILLQNIDFVVYNYVLLCSNLLLWSMMLFFYEGVLYRATYGKPRKYTRLEITQSFGRLLDGPFVRTWMYFTMNKDGRFPSWVPIPIEAIVVYTDIILFSPWFILLLWLPVVSALYSMESFLVVVRYCNLLVDDHQLEKVFELLNQQMHQGGPGMYPLHHFVNGYMEYVHGFWKLIGCML